MFTYLSLLKAQGRKLNEELTESMFLLPQETKILEMFMSNLKRLHSIISYAKYILITLKV